MTKHKSLWDYAARRFRFAGNALLEFNDPFFAQIDRLRAEFEAQGKHFVSFANYDYLGLANHPRIVEEAEARAAIGLGVGALASRLVGGERSTHKPFEAEIAEFLGMESALTLVSGYLANVTTIAWLMAASATRSSSTNSRITASSPAPTASPARGRSNSATTTSIISNICSRSHREDYRHVLIVVEGIYSMDGDTADLPRLLEIKERHQVWLMVDEAHSLGVLGETGRGLAEHQGVDPERASTSSSAPCRRRSPPAAASSARKKPVIDWFRYTLPGFVYSVGLSPVILAAARTALRLMQEETLAHRQARAQRRTVPRLSRTQVG